VIEPPATLLHLIREMNKEWIRHSYRALQRLEPDSRHISTILLHVSHANYEKIQRKVEQLREEVLRLAEDEESPECVAQLSMQLFPRSSEEKRK
jgi:uncharacterized protein (TIGR02147 family)